MKYKYEIILDEDEAHFFEEYAHDFLSGSLKKSIYPPPTGRPPTSYDKEKFIDLYLSYVFKEISKEKLLESLGMGKTTFHKILKQLKEEEELPLYSRAELHKYNTLIELHRFSKEEVNWD